ncbi:MAG: Ca-activated chloride channel family protein [Verrucomicrobiales bacterium]|jgi:Ca-activated chloride channel family protein
MKTLPSFITKITVALALIYATPSIYSACTLTPKGSPHAPIVIRDHHVKVTINNGFAQTEVTQTFFNPNAVDLEAVYRFPLPESASLSEVSLTMGEREIHGEVVERENARTIYESGKRYGTRHERGNSGIRIQGPPGKV